VSQPDSKTIPLAIVEEHHEAFYVWNYAVRKGWLQSSGYTLLHVDAHADILLPRLRRPLSSIGDLADLAEFTYRELDISDFIWPAMYQGLFDRYLWLKYRHRFSAGGWRSIAIQSKNVTSTEFRLTELNGLPVANSPDARIVEYAPITTRDVIKTDQPIVLDLDLDYFCSNDYPDLPQRELEITKQTFDEFTNNRYHFLRISPADKISACERNGGYYLVYNDYYPDDSGRGDQRAQASERVEDFGRWLERCKIEPSLIVICRSFHSGYTPGRLCDDIQREVITILEGLYSVAQTSIDEILPGVETLAGDVVADLGVPA
jgi:UPF0489 domain